VHQDIADTFLPALSKQMAESGVTCTPMPNRWPRCKRPGKVEPVKAEQYDDEFCRWI
jgi:glutamate-5-semialdehyde dehydrogenase